MRRNLCIAILILSLPLAAFEEKPWLADFLSFYLDSSFMYYRFRHVDNAVKQLRTPANNELVTFDLGFIPFDGWEAALELELSHTPRQKIWEA